MGNSKPAKPPEQTFETSIQRLEHIVEEMEGEKLALDQLLELYEEGAQLVKVCQEKLDAAEKRIDIITRNAAGKPQLTPFEPSVPVDPSSAPEPAPHASENDSDEVRLF